MKPELRAKMATEPSWAALSSAPPSQLFEHLTTCLFNAALRCFQFSNSVSLLAVLQVSAYSFSTGNSQHLQPTPAPVAGAAVGSRHQLRLQLINVSHYIKFYLALGNSAQRAPSALNCLLSSLSPSLSCLPCPHSYSFVLNAACHTHTDTHTNA